MFKTFAQKTSLNLRNNGKKYNIFAPALISVWIFTGSILIYETVRRDNINLKIRRDEVLNKKK